MKAPDPSTLKYLYAGGRHDPSGVRHRQLLQGLPAVLGEAPGAGQPKAGRHGQ